MVSKPEPAAPGAWAVVRGDEPRVFLAENEHVISRLLALQLVAKTSPDEVSSRVMLEEIRRALLAEEWAVALATWIEETGSPVDVYPESLKVWTEADLDSDSASMEIRMAPIFAD